MTTGVQCTRDPACRTPAPAKTGICRDHEPQRPCIPSPASPPLVAAARALGRALGLSADREPEAGG